MANQQVLGGPPSSDELPSEDKPLLSESQKFSVPLGQHSGQQQNSNQNVRNTSSSAPAARRTKGGGSAYESSSSRAPRPAGSQIPSGVGGASQPSTNPISQEAGTSAPNYVPAVSPGQAAGQPQGGGQVAPSSGTNVQDNLRHLESQEARQPLTDYDNGGATSPGNQPDSPNQANPSQSNKKGGVGRKGSKTENFQIPTLRSAENNNLFGGGKGGIGGKAKGAAKKKLIEYAKKKKWKILAAGGGIGGSMFLILAILFLLGTLLIPHFLSNVIGWQFVKVTRAAYEATQAVVDEQLAVAANKDTAAADSKYLTDQTYKDIKELTPDEMNKAVENLGYGTANDPFKENVDKKTGKVISVTFENQNTPNGNTFTTENITSGFNGGKLDVPPSLANPTVNEALTTEATVLEDTFDPYKGAGTVVLETDVPVFQNEVGPPGEDLRSGLDPDKYKDGISQIDAEKQITKDDYEKIKVSDAAGASPIDEINQQSEEANTIEDAAIKDPTKLAQIVNSFGNISQGTIDFLNKQIVQSALKSFAQKVGNILNPASGNLAAFCIVYEGSKYNPPAAQAHSQEVQRTAVLSDAVADQQRRGSPKFTATMAGAENWKLEGDPRAGGVTRTIAIERASGQKVNTNAQLSAEGSPLGGLANSGNIISALGIPGSGAFTSALDAACPALTNVWVNVGLGVINLTASILLAIFTAGGGTAAEVAFEGGADAASIAASDAVVNGILDRVAVSLSSKEALSAGLDVLKDFAKKAPVSFIKQAGMLAGITFLAKIYVISQSGILHQGTATGIPHDNDVDQGNNILTNAMVANAYGGRPLTNSEAVQVQRDNQKTLAGFNASQSAYKRYLALSNPQSLASVLADRVAVNLNYGFFSTVVSSMGNIFNPASLMPQILFGNLSGQANAATTLDEQDYGDVQQGFSDAEYNLIHSSVGHAKGYDSPSENKYQLDQSGVEDQIDQTYSPCFNQSVATLLGETTNGTPDIVRDANGDIDPTQGLCSPQNLGPNNPQYSDLVFRYRLARGYTTTIHIFHELGTNAT